MGKNLINSAFLKKHPIILGCMRINSLENVELENLINESLDAGINFF